MVASEQGHLPVVKTLLEHSAAIDLKDEVWPPLPPSTQPIILSTNQVL